MMILPYIIGLPSLALDFRTHGSVGGTIIVALLKYQIDAGIANSYSLLDIINYDTGTKPLTPG
jgi:hypothetical protein